MPCRKLLPKLSLVLEAILAFKSILSPRKSAPSRGCQRCPGPLSRDQQYFCRSWDHLAVSFIGLIFNMPLDSDNVTIVAFNTLYDILNTPSDALQAQAKTMDPKQCKEYPADGKRPRWGGAGYHHLHNQNCDRYPASYLGSGLYFNTELREPHRQSCFGLG